MTESVSSPHVTNASRQSFINFTAGSVVGFIQVIMAVSVANLIFTGDLAPYLPYGVGMVLVSSVIHALVTSLLTPSANIISKVQDNVAVVAGLVATNAVKASAPEASFATLFATLFIVTFLVGVSMFLIGRFQLSDLVRYMPYPVIGGFLAGTGVLLIIGAITSMSDGARTTEALFMPNTLPLWLSGVCFAVLLLISMNSLKHFLVLPVFLIVAFAIFYSALALSGTTLEEARTAGWLLAGMEGGASWQPLPIDALLNADWHAILLQAGDIFAIVLISVIFLLLNISGLELLLRTDLDLNRELRAAGVANIVAALLGGAIGFRTLGMSTLSYRLGARGHATSLAISLISALVFLAGVSFLGFMPVPILGGLLVYLGLGFVQEWILQGRRKFSFGDYLVILIIVLVMSVAGVLMGLTVGILLMAASFLVNTSRLNIFRNVFDGSEATSNVTRSVYHRNVLREEMVQTYILQLQGYLFFGTANKIVAQVQERLSQARLSFLIIDFKRVSSMDSSAVLSFTKVLFLAESKGFVVVMCNVRPDIYATTQAGGLHMSDCLKSAPDLDRALEFCETSILERDQVTTAQLLMTFQRLLTENGFSKDDIATFKGYLTSVRLNTGDKLFQEGDAPDMLYFIEVGQVSIYQARADGGEMRLQTMLMGSVVGEIGFYMRNKRTATVIADTNTWLHALSRADLQRLQEEHPRIAFLLKDIITRFIGERLLRTNARLATLESM